MSSVQVWKSELYDSKLGFISEFGKDVVQLLNPIKDEQILDLGCGTGDLAYEIGKSGASVTGMDYSENMIRTARDKYPQMNFLVGNAEDFKLDRSFDSVFSNAALHWMKEPKKVLACVWSSLNKGGKFVAEFGGKGNVETIIKATSEVLSEDHGIDASKLNPWYFPSIAEYSTLLELQGFRVTHAVHFDRPTKLEDNENGLNHWLTAFADDFFKGFSEDERDRVIVKIAAKAKNDLFQEGSWYLDYKRIRIMAIKA